MADTIHVDIVSAEGELFSGEAVLVIAPGTLGELGIAPRHAPLLTTLKPGNVRVQVEGQDEQVFYVGGGALEVQPNRVTVLADTAARAKDLDEAEARPRSSAPRNWCAPARTNERLPRRKPSCCALSLNCERSSACARNADTRLTPGARRASRGAVMPLSVVILAAGQGKRMNSDLPKVLQPLAGQPLLQHVIRTARALNPANIYVVYGHGGAQVRAAFDHEEVDWVLQAEQLGTGHAVMQAMSAIPTITPCSCCTAMCP
jgi:ATP synthase F1 epsilon subunit